MSGFDVWVLIFDFSHVTFQIHFSSLVFGCIFKRLIRNGIKYWGCIMSGKWYYRKFWVFRIRWQQWCWITNDFVMVIYSEKATKIFEIFTLLLTGTTYDKSKVKISQNFVAFSEYMNFNWAVQFIFISLS